MATPAPSSFQATAPEWADDARLDEAFSSWTPGPGADAHAMEHEMSRVPGARLDDDLTATLNAALVDASNEFEVPAAAAPSYALPGYATDDAVAPLVPVEVAPLEDSLHDEAFGESTAFEPPVAPQAVLPWSRHDDDILPGKGHHLHVPTAKVKAPKAHKVKAPKESKAPKAPKVESVEPAASDRKPVKVFGLTLRK